jgi:hypothetical protein
MIFIPQEMKNICLLSFVGLADTVISPMWYIRTACFLLKGINFQMVAVCWRALLLAATVKASL